MNHWLKKKKEKEINQTYADYANDYWHQCNSGWHHIAVVYKNNKTTHYVDGQKTDADKVWKTIASGYTPQP